MTPKGYWMRLAVTPALIAAWSVTTQLDSVHAYTPTDETTACEVGTSRLVEQPPSALDMLGIPDAWKLSRGQVVVAVVDSGVDASNVHLTDAVLPGLDLVDSGDGRTDTAGHGTAVAGQIASREVAGSGLVGVAPDAMILPVRVYGEVTDQAIAEGRGPDTSKTAAGIKWAAEQGAKIIVVAQSSETDDPALKEAVTEATARGALVVASNGNLDEETDPTAPRFPASYPPALSVTAVTADGLPSDQVVHNEYVEVAAPGAHVLTTFLGYGDCVLAGDRPTTSYATGYVAGIAALVAAAYPGETPADWEYRILSTALRPTQSLRDDQVGWGIVAPYDALNFLNDGTLRGPDNPRFPAPAAPSMSPMPPPESPEDLRPARAWALGITTGVGVLVGLSLLMLTRLRRRS